MVSEKTSFPIFVLGVGRSGTTLLQRILNSHPKVNLWGEHGGFLHEIAGAYFLQLENTIVAKRAFAEEETSALSAKLKDPEEWQGWINGYTREDAKKNFHSFVTAFFKKESLEAETHWGFKEIRYGASRSRAAEMLAELYPDARFIMIIREPVDVVASQLAAWPGARKKTPERLASDWDRDNQHYLHFARSFRERCLLIRYEDLVSFSDESLAVLTDFLGLDYRDKAFILSLDKGRGTTRETEGIPRERLSDEDILKVQEITRATAKIFCYC